MLKGPRKNNPLTDLFGLESPHVKLEAWRIHNSTVRLRYLAGIIAAVILKHWLG